MTSVGGLRLDEVEVFRLSDRAQFAHCRAAFHCAKHLTDGYLTEIELSMLRVRAPERRELVESGVWDEVDRGIQIRDYLAENPSRAQVEARRKGNLLRARRHREKDDITPPVTALRTPLLSAVTNAVANGESGTSVPRSPSGISGSGSSPDPDGFSLVLASDQDLKESARVSEERAKIAEVFAGWQEAFGKQKSKLDTKRERRIRKLLRHGFTAEQLIRAMKNAKLDPFLMGKNQDGKVYNGIQTLLRDPEQVERLLELKPMNGSGGVSAPYHAPARIEPEVPLADRPSYEEIKAMTSSRRA